jgi:hypothetical protein
LGYGTPQLPLLSHSLADLFDARPLVVEPAQPDMPPRHSRFPRFRMERVRTVGHPHTAPGRNEYLWRAGAILNEFEPDVLLVSCTYSIPVLFRLRKRPRLVLYYSLESVSFYGEFDLEMNHYVEPLVDVVIFSEENRATRDVRAYSFRHQEKVILYNCSTRHNDLRPPLPAEQRNGRILHAGTIGPQTFSQYFSTVRTSPYPIDLFGPIRPATDEERADYLKNLRGSIRYRGFIPAEDLARERPVYFYSIIMWDPKWGRDQNYFAAPNKLFEAIADGVPPISAPHPQCELLIDRYRCGLLMPDWSYEGFLSTLKRAMRLRGTEAWKRMAANCARAARLELNWETQFAKVARCIGRAMGSQSVVRTQPSVRPTG